MILEQLKTLFDELRIPVETGVFSDRPPAEYVVLTPLTDDFALFADNRPQYDVSEVRISLYCLGNYLRTKSRILYALTDAGFTVTEKRYVERENDTGYFHYSIDVAKEYQFETDAEPHCF